MNSTLRSRGFLLSLGGHVLLIVCLLFSFENTIQLPEQPQLSMEQNRPIIDATMVNQKIVEQEIHRLDQIEKKKIQQEENRRRELAQKEREAVAKRQKEEALALELQKKNEILRKEAELQKIAKEKQLKAEKLEKERLAKEKKKQEDELKKIQKQKEEALAQQKKIDEQRRLAEEEQARQQANIKVKETALTQHAMLIREKIHRTWRQPLGFSLAGLKCKLDVKLLPTGDVTHVVILTSSGNLEFDRSAELAVYKASPLPMPSDPDLASEFRQFSFTFNPPGAV